MCSCQQHSTTASAATPAPSGAISFRVEDMTCGHCTAAIEKAVAEAGGRAVTDLASHSVTVEGLDEARAAQVIRDAGYTPLPA